MNEILRVNLLSPIPLAFVLGILARVIRSEFTLPKELAHSTFDAIARPAAVTLVIGCITPISAYLTLRYLGRFGEADSAGIAAHYGSVSAVTFIAASTFVKGVGAEPEGFMPTLLTLLESPGIHIALAIGVIRSGAKSSRPLSELLHEVFTGRTMVLLVGGLLVGALMGEKNWKTIEPFYDTKGAIFRGALCIFMLEMGLLAGARLGDLKKVGPFLLGFGMVMPLIHGALGAWLGTLAGLSVGGATMLAAMAASASYIAAPPAVRMTIPDANPTYSLTLALAITFPFNVLIGIPVYYSIARAAHGIA
jgi:uncharacterized protein